MSALDPPTTCPRLLSQLFLPDSDAAWAVFIGRYAPLIEARCRKARLQSADVDDIRSAVFTALLRALRDFRHDPAHRFRGYIQTIVDNAIRSHWRVLSRRPGWVGNGGDTALPEPLARLSGELDDQMREGFKSYDQVIDTVRFEVGPVAWGAFWLTTHENLTGAEAAEQLGISPSAVYTAKSRIIKTLRKRASASTSS
ncbi:MAG: sigma-70 family RNA polymerase sigma factor [Isosphaeraceae bacterium]|nr:sigma-70 family RNA polymerase sigma factor [Isosphaeraceae bacterium]